MATVHSEGTVPEQSLPPGRISGICQRETGEPLAGLRVNVYGPDDILVDTQKTDGRGRYATRLLFSGKYRVELRRFPDGVVASQRCEVRLGEVCRLDFIVARQVPVQD